MKQTTDNLVAAWVVDGERDLGVQPVLAPVLAPEKVSDVVGGRVKVLDVAAVDAGNIPASSRPCLIRYSRI